MARHDPPMRSRGRDDAAFEQFFVTVLPRAVAFAARVTGDRAAAEDAAVAALAKAHMRWRRLADEPWREAWVLRVSVNEAIDQLPRRLVLPAPSAEPDPADQVVLRGALRVALRTLPRRQREVVALRYLVGLGEVEIGQTLRISHGTVKTHLRRGLGALRRVMDPPIEEAPHADPA